MGPRLRGDDSGNRCAPVPSRFDCQTARASQRSAARILCRGAGDACLPFPRGSGESPPTNVEGAERREALPYPYRAALLAKRGRLSALHRGFSVPAPCFRARTRAGSAARAAWEEASALLSRPREPSRAGPPSAPGRLAGASRERGYEPRPRAPHPTPLTRRLMRTPSSGWDEGIKSQDYYPVNNKFWRFPAEGASRLRISNRRHHWEAHMMRARVDRIEAAGTRMLLLEALSALSDVHAARKGLKSMH